ncbi:MAG: hypothetical protein PVJ53_00580 [Desulfobacterales bacterium]|jgi:hypothetical protein
MIHLSPSDHLPASDAEDRPFCMSEAALPALSEIQEMADSQRILSAEAIGSRLPFRGLLIAAGLLLPLGALLWIVVF